MGKEKLSKLAKGDIIVVEYGSDMLKAKVIENYPEGGKIYIKIKLYNFLPFWFFPFKIIRSYDSYNFENFNILNPGK